MARILLTNATIVTGASTKKGALAIDGERIVGIWHRSDSDSNDSEALRVFPDAEVIDLEGKVLMAGGIDAHVHFREPGMEWKADIESESKAALLGGVTSFLDMPNTIPPTTDLDALKDKLNRASERSWANYGFHIGATNGNAAMIREYLAEGLGGKFGGIKVFMGSSTGNMLVDDDKTLSDLFRIKGKPILIHSEDEGIIKANLEAAKAKFGEDIPFREHPLIRSRKACIRSTAKALAMAIEYGTRLHVLHVSTAEEVEMIRAAKIHNPNITAETSANYLWFSDEDYETLKGKEKCNPAIKTATDREALRKGLAEGIIDTIGSDHAPHLLTEKVDNYLKCPSGLPSVQQSLSVVMTVADIFNEGKEEGLLTLSRIASAFSEKPAEILGIKERGSLKVGNHADLVVIDPEREYSVQNHSNSAANNPEPGHSVQNHAVDLADNAPEPNYSVEKAAYKCGWSPYDGVKFKGMIDKVFLNGIQVIADGSLIQDFPSGQPIAFTL
ncbi:MAG TPA: dihydroorotase [Rikenellaceae bacterium]|nr:dihydroorotase [Rikenellaceae bacterium]